MIRRYITILLTCLCVTAEMIVSELEMGISVNLLTV